MKITRISGLLAAGMLALSLLLPSTSVLAGGHAAPVVTVKVEAEFADMLEAVKSAIDGRGLNVAHTLPASDMLGRTGPAFGITEAVFQNAEIIEFCSAKISHNLAKANPENILLCPFTVAVYVLGSDPEHVRLSYRVPYLMGDEASAKAVQQMLKLVEGIIAEAEDW